MQQVTRSETTTSTQYRTDLDGLRGICIVSAICFHAGIPGASGGFAVIDSFFVISGYVITRTILEQQNQNQFSLQNFFTRRILRLVPATVPMFFLTTLFCAILMNREEVSKYTLSVFAAQFFNANSFFYFVSNYFNPVAESQPLLHFWSLSIEEQFYMGWPLAILLAARWIKRKTLVLLVGVAALSSFSLMLWMHPTWSDANFYLLPSRMWEFFAGVLAAYIGPFRLAPLTRQLVSMGGLIAFIGYLLTVNPQGGYPNFSTLIPVMGTFAIIIAGDAPADDAIPANLTDKILCAGWIVWLGQISYSLYLWHWPVLTLTRLGQAQTLSTLVSALLMLTIIPIAWASWRWIEQPWRKKAQLENASWIAAGTLLGSIALALLSASLGKYANSFWERRPEVAQALQDHAAAAASTEGCHSWNPGLLIPDCTHKPTSKPVQNWLLIGDSHADALDHDLSAGLNAKNISLTHLTQSSCPVGLGFEVWQEINNSQTLNCAASNQLMLEKIASNREITTVVLASRWAVYMGQTAPHGKKVVTMKDGVPVKFEERLWEFLEELRRRRGNDLNIYILGPIPDPGYSMPNCVEKRARLMRDPEACLIQPSHQQAGEVEMARSMLARLASKVGAQIIDIADVFCDKQQCRFGTTDVLWWRDDNHLARAGAKKAVSAIINHVEKAP
jgi:peptidoglycan/LPS O-acetylase OafA/YrhL